VDSNAPLSSLNRAQKTKKNTAYVIVWWCTMV